MLRPSRDPIPSEQKLFYRRHSAAELNARYLDTYLCRYGSVLPPHYLRHRPDGSVETVPVPLTHPERCTPSQRGLKVCWIPFLARTVCFCLVDLHRCASWCCAARPTDKARLRGTRLGSARVVLRLCIGSGALDVCLCLTSRGRSTLRQIRPPIIELACFQAARLCKLKGVRLWLVAVLDADLRKKQPRPPIFQLFCLSFLFGWKCCSWW